MVQHGAHVLVPFCSCLPWECAKQLPCTGQCWLGELLLVENWYLGIEALVTSGVHRVIHSHKIAQLACNVHVNKAIKVYKYSVLPYSL